MEWSEKDLGVGINPENGESQVELIWPTSLKNKNFQMNGMTVIILQNLELPNSV